MTLKLRNVSKTFTGTVALRQVNLEVPYGAVHALAGQNGSGKSTLIKLLSGYHQPDPGAHMEIDGRSHPLGDAAVSRSAGLRFVHQDLALIGSLSVVDNMMLGRPYPTGRARRIRWDVATRQAEQYLDQLGVRVDPRATVASLSMSERSAVAIARALSDSEEGKRLLVVLDEPTASLPPDEVGRLLDAIRGLRDQGHGVLLVTHHLSEVLAVADHISVLRDGQMVASTPRDGVDYHQLAELIVGHAVAVHQPGAARGAEPTGEGLALSVRGLKGGRLEHLDLDLAPGQIVGFAGITGSGRESVGPLLAGGLERRGTVQVAGRNLPGGNPSRALAAGVVAIPGERARLGVFPNLNVRANLTISDLARHRRFGRVRGHVERDEVNGWIERLGIVTAGPDAPIGSLSGGNQQKVLVGRALRLSPRVLVLDDPTQGIDIGARAQIHDVIERCAAEGMAVVLVSTDSDELARLSDSVHILVGGRVAATLGRGPALTDRAIDAAQIQKLTPAPEPDASRDHQRTARSQAATAVAAVKGDR